MPESARSLEELEVAARTDREQRGFVREGDDLREAADALAVKDKLLGEAKHEFEIVREASRLFEDASNIWMDRALTAEKLLGEAVKALEPFAKAAIINSLRTTRPIEVEHLVFARTTLANLKAEMEKQ